jgi:uncharacterized repeat protein (TIGR03803 family)
VNRKQLIRLACAFAALAPLPAYAQAPASETILHNFGLPPLSGAHPYGGLIADNYGNLYGTTAQGGIYGAGVVFELDPKGRQTLLYAFTGGADGKTPNAGVIRDLEGNLYGTTTYGGSANSGVVYKIDTSRSQTVLHSFTGGADGGNPYATLAFDPEGNLYGTTTYGGTASLGVVFSMDRISGSEKVLYSFLGGADGAGPNAGVILDPAYNIYGTTTYGGAANSGVIYKLDGTNHETVLYSFTGGNDGRYPYAGVIRDANGNLYGAASSASQSAGVIYKLDPAGNQTVLYSFQGDANGEYPTGNLLRDPQGNLYGTTQKGGNSYGVVFKLDAAGQLTVIHRFGGPDGSHPYAGLILNAKGHLCGTTSSGGAVSEGVVFTLDGAGNETVLYDFPGPGDGRQPSGVALDSADNLYGTATEGGSAGHGIVFSVDTEGHESILYNFKGKADGGYPRTGVAVGSAGMLFGTTSEGGVGQNGVVYQVDIAGRETVLHSFTYADGANPNGVIVDADGNIYGTTFQGGSANAGVVFEMDASGHYSVLYNFPGGANGGPEGNLTRDSAGNLYGTTAGNTAGLGVVYRVDTTGRETVLYTFAMGAGGYNPYGGMTLDVSGNLYGTTYQGGAANNGVVFKLDTAGHYSVLHSFAGGADGAHPGSGLTMDSSGNLYGSTTQGGSGNDGVVYRIDPSGQETVLYTFTGSDGASPGSQPVRNLAGKLFGTTSAGGKNGGGVVFKLTLH